MPAKPLFSGLVVDKYDRPVEIGFIGSEPAYIINDAGFRRHVPSEQIDRTVLNQIMTSVSENQDQVVDQTAKMLGQDDIFSRAMLKHQLENIDQQVEQVLASGFPEEMRAYMGMMGFKIVVDIHGEVLRVEQPAKAADEGDE